MTRTMVTTAVLALALTACARFDGAREMEPQARSADPVYVPSYTTARAGSQAPLLSGATVTGDTIREDE